jgi:hypothetical protein
VEVLENENVARYIYQSNHYRPSDNTVKHHAFMPPDDKKVSVFRTEGLAESEVWALSDAQGDRIVKARADIVIRVINATGLQIDPDDEPPRHANIVGWPSDKEASMEKALLLAKQSQLRMRPPIIM